MATPSVARKQPKSTGEDTENSGSVLQTPFANLPFPRSSKVRQTTGTIKRKMSAARHQKTPRLPQTPSSSSPPSSPCLRKGDSPAVLAPFPVQSDRNAGSDNHLVRFLSSSDSEAMEPYTKRGWDKGSEDVVEALVQTEDEDRNKTPRANAIAERSPTPFPRPLRPYKEENDEEYFLAPNDHGARMEMRNLERIVNDQQLREGLDDLETLLSSMENTARQTSRKIEVIQQLRVGVKERFLDQTMRPFAKARLGRTPDSRTQRNERVGTKIGLEDELFGTGSFSYSSTAKPEASGGKTGLKRQHEGDDLAKHRVDASASKRVKFSVG